MSRPVPASGVRVAALTAVRAACVVAVGGAALLAGALTGMPTTGGWLWLSATVLVAAVVMASGSWAERFATRVAFGPDGDAHARLSAFAQRISDTLAVDDVLPRVAQTVTQATHGTSSEVRLWLPAGGELRETWPAVPTPGSALAADVRLRHRGEEVGALGVATDGGRLPADTRLLLDRLAGTAGLALANVRLAYDLRDRIAESRALSVQLEHSRQRLVDAAAEETERFSRLVAGQVLDRLGRAGAALDAAERGDPAALREAAGGVSAALEALRDLAAGVFPPTLSDNGLAVALEALAGRYAGRVLVRRTGEGGTTGPGARPAPPVEAAAYRCVLEVVEDVTTAGGTAVLDTDLSGSAVAVTMTADRSPSPAVLQLLQDRVEATDGVLEVAADGDEATHRMRLSWPSAPVRRPGVDGVRP